MTNVIGVRFKSSGRIYYFDPGMLSIKQGDGVIVETARGIEFADVAEGPHEVEDSAVVQPLKTVLRVASAEDVRKRAEFAAKESDAFAIGEKKIKAHELDMKLVGTEYAFDGSRLVFYFTADERVDFRELVRDLASQFHTRIELRQIGVRDEAKMLGGLGPCGRPVCCKAFLDDFRPVSIKMAKEQNLSLSPTKISGLCGRLMCCLQYEQSAYDDAKKRMPRVGKEMTGPDGTGVVVENNAITEKTKLRITMEDGTIDVREYPYELLVKPGDPLPVPRPKADQEGEAAEAAAVSEREVPVHRTAPVQHRNTERAEKEQARRIEMKKRCEPKKTLEEHISEEAASEAAEAANAPAAEAGEAPQKSSRRHRRGGRGNGRRNGEENTVKTEQREPNGASAAGEASPEQSGEPKKKHRRPHHRGGKRPNAGQGDASAAPSVE